MSLQKSETISHAHRRQYWGVGGHDPPDFKLGGRGGLQEVVKHYYILSSTGSMFESGDFSSEIE